jgi:hypothetical protein
MPDVVRLDVLHSRVRPQERHERWHVEPARAQASEAEADHLALVSIELLLYLKPVTHG